MPQPTYFHPDYGLGDARRLAALRCAETIGLRRAAVAFDVSLSSLYVWRKRYGPEVLRFVAQHEAAQTLSPRD